MPFVGHCGEMSKGWERLTGSSGHRGQAQWLYWYQPELLECARKIHKTASYGTDGRHGHAKIWWHEVTLGPVQEGWVKRLQKLTPGGTATCLR